VYVGERAKEGGRNDDRKDMNEIEKQHGSKAGRR
jgi:hypothetical protein